MTSQVTEVAPDVYRLSTYVEDYRLQVNQFLIRDEEPFLMHTSFKKLFPLTRQAVASILDPAQLRWIGFSHFESDECGALNEWLGEAPQAQAVCSLVGALVNLNDFAIRPARALANDEVLVTGRRRLRFLATPHVPHCWDAGLFFEETERTLLCSDLFFHAGDPEPFTESDVVGRAQAAMRENQLGAFANDLPYTPYTDFTLQQLADLKPRTLGLMHGSTFSGDGGQALRDLASVIRDVLKATPKREGHNG